MVAGRLAYPAPARLAWDGFGRADAASLGTSDAGRAWTVGNSTDAAVLPTWNVASGKASVSALGSQNDAHAWLECGAPDVTLTCMIVAPTAASAANSGLLLRRVDASNYLAIRFVPASSLVTILRNLATVRTTVYSQTLAVADNQLVRLEVRLRGEKITPKVNGVWLPTYTETNFPGGTKFGLYQIGAATGGATFDDFLVERAA